MDWMASVDLYCERTGPELWSEPLNAVSNLAFLAAAVCALWRARGAGADFAAVALAWVVLAVGLGSLAFHTLATRAAALADVLPIAVFIYGYFGFALRRYLGLSWPGTAALLAGLFGLTMAMEALPRAVLNGSAGYLPALAAGAGIAGALWRRGHPAAPALAAAASIFAVSLTFRSIDLTFCAGFPAGTHFVWHLLNAAVLGIYLHAAIAHAPRKNLAPAA